MKTQSIQPIKPIHKYSYILLYKLNQQDQNSTRFIQYQTLQQIYKNQALPKLGIHYYQTKLKKKNMYTLKQIIKCLQYIPYLRVYQYQQNIIDNQKGQRQRKGNGNGKGDLLKPIPNFAHDFRIYLKQRTKQIEKTYDQILKVSNYQGPLKLKILISMSQIKEKKKMDKKIVQTEIQYVC